MNKKTFLAKKNVSGILWVFKSKLQIIHVAIYIALFLFSYVWCHVSLSVSTIFSLYFYFYLLFHSLLATRHILQLTMFDSISLQPARNITEIRNTS